MPNPQKDALAALDALPTELIPAALTKLASMLLAAPPAHDDDRLLTAAQVAKELSISPRSVWKNWRELGGKRLPNGRGLRFSRRALLRRVA